MKNVLLIYLVLIAAIGGWWIVTKNEWFKPRHREEKPKALAVSKHSDEFNRSIEKALDAYHKTTASFVNADINGINSHGNELLQALQAMNLDEMKKDTAGIYETAVVFMDDTKGSVQQMINETAIESKRKAFKDVSDNIFTLLNTIHYDSGELYWMECATAFGEGSPANWLSKSEHSDNPYGQKDCGVVKKTINVVKS